MSDMSVLAAEVEAAYTKYLGDVAEANSAVATAADKVASITTAANDLTDQIASAIASNMPGTGLDAATVGRF